jgi:hypothetical protein
VGYSFFRAFGAGESANHQICKSANLMNFELQSMAIDLPPFAAHPNRAPFRGVLTLVDTPSDRAPAGAKGHRVLLTRAAAEKAIPSLLGMALDYAPSLDRHDAQRKVGIITEANVVGDRLSAVGARARWPMADGRPPQGEVPRLEIFGYLYARDFPEVIRELQKQCGPGLRPGIAGQRPAPHQLGMSYEITDARNEDVRAAVWVVSECTFTGAAILRRDKAAYSQTWIELIG